MIVRVERLVAGGVGLAHEPDGRVVLVDGGLPGDEVLVRPVRTKRDVVHAVIDEVVAASPDRVAPPCPAVAAGCGGCDLQHAAVVAQAQLRVGVVADALRRLGGIAEPVVRAGPQLPAHGYRTTVRMVVQGGRAAFRARASNDAVPVESCLVTHPAIDELIRDGRFGSAREVTLRAGARTGERLALVDPSIDGVQLPADVLLVGANARRRGRGSVAHIHEEIAGRRWRISARAFFQPSAEGAEALVAVAGALAGDALGAGPLVDLYAGVGLFAGTLGVAARAVDPTTRVIVVERHRDAVADARSNLADLGALVMEVDVDSWRPRPAALVVADPSRDGLRTPGVEAVAGTGAQRLVLVSCDAAALGRDARLLAGAGFRAVESVVVDQFAMTSHVEVVTRFDRS
jgi:23S rRNA (uracil1939-C5)-methyltransferase